FIIGRGFPKEYVDADPYNYKTPADADFIADVQARVERRFPAFSGMKLLEAYAALYDVQQDWYPFVGPRSGTVRYADFSGGCVHGRARSQGPGTALRRRDSARRRGP